MFNNQERGDLKKGNDFLFEKGDPQEWVKLQGQIKQTGIGRDDVAPEIRKKGIEEALDFYRKFQKIKKQISENQEFGDKSEEFIRREIIHAQKLLLVGFSPEQVVAMLKSISTKLNGERGEELEYEVRKGNGQGTEKYRFGQVTAKEVQRTYNASNGLFEWYADGSVWITREDASIKMLAETAGLQSSKDRMFMPAIPFSNNGDPEWLRFHNAFVKELDIIQVEERHDKKFTDQIQKEKPEDYEKKLKDAREAK